MTVVYQVYVTNAGGEHAESGGRFEVNGGQGDTDEVAKHRALTYAADLVALLRPYGSANFPVKVRKETVEEVGS